MQPDLYEFQCSVCLAPFRSQGTLNRHSRIHLDERPFQCLECDKTFTRSDLLRLHSIKHTGVRPFQCKECGHCFTEKGSLRRHFRLHTGEKPYSCSQCDKRFSETTSLKLHLRKHSTEKPFKCLVCGRSYKDANYMMKHAETHENQFEHECPECGDSFQTKSLLRIHLRAHYGSDDDQGASIPYGDAGSINEDKSIDNLKVSIITEEASNESINTKLLLSLVKSQLQQDPKESKPSPLSEEPVDSLPEENEPCSPYLLDQDYIGEDIQEGEKSDSSAGNENLFLCTKCGEVFSRNSVLQKHMQSHDNNEEFTNTSTTTAPTIIML